MRSLWSPGLLVGGLVVLNGLGAVGCTPDIDPSWLIRRPTELALRSEVVAQGPWGDPQPEDAPRTFYDALPGDTLRFTPLVVDEEGPVPGDELSTRWVICPANECLDALARSDDLPPCDSLSPYTNIVSCTPGVGSSLDYTLGPAPTDIDEASLFSLAVGPNIALVASREDDPGATACAVALRERTDLTGCVIMLRSVTIGPASALVEAAEALGIEIEIPDTLAPLLAVPRNRNPEVEFFEVRGSSLTADVQTVPNGGAIQAMNGDELTIRWVPDDEDFDNYEVELSGEAILVEETLAGQYFFDRPSSVFEENGLSVTLRAEGDGGRSNLYFVASDGGGSETWGRLTLDISGG